MYFALGVLLVLAAMLLERRIVQVSLITWLVFAVLHFVVHLTATRAFSPFDNLAQLGSLGFLVLHPLVLLAFSSKRGTSSRKTGTLG
jgi:hypothetical protein